MRNRYLVFGIIFGVFTSGSLALAQAMGRGRMKGSVHDTEGKPIEGAAITAEREDGKSVHVLETTSDSDGEWALLGFRSTRYEFNITAEGFQSQVSIQNVVQMGKNPFMDVVLPRLQIQEAAASGGPSALDKANEFFEQKHYARSCRQVPRASGRGAHLLPVELQHRSRLPPDGRVGQRDRRL